MANNVSVKPNTSTGSVPVATYEDQDGVHWPLYMPSEHGMIHKGKMFYAGVIWGSGNEIANGASAQILIQVSSGMHMVYDISCGGHAEVHIFRNPTFGPQGTTVNIFNKNEYYSTASTATITHTPTVSVDGTELPPKILPGGVKTAGSGGQDGSFSRELILKGGNDYLMRVTNISGAIQIVGIAMEWYEA